MYINKYIYLQKWLHRLGC